jgi:hypothetical protein
VERPDFEHQGEIFSPDTQETVGETMVAGDAIRLRREDTGYVTKLLPILGYSEGHIMIGRSPAGSGNRYWFGEATEDGKITSKGITYEILGLERGAAGREATVSRAWRICLERGAYGGFYRVPELNHEELRQVAEWLIKSQSILDTQEKLSRALLTLFDGNAERAVAVLSAYAQNLVTKRGGRLDAKLGNLELYGL